MSLKRLRPEDWLWALRAGIESVGLGWLLVVLITVSVALSASSLDAAAALSVGQALRAGTGLWSLAFGGSVGGQDSDNGVLGLPLLGLTVLQWFWTRNCVRRARPSGLLSGAWAWTSATGTAALVAQAGPAQGRTWPAVVGLSLLSAAVIALDLRRGGRTPQALLRWWDMRPHWVSPGLSLARGAAVALGLLSLVVLLVAAATSLGRVSHLHDSLAGGGILASLGLVALQAAWLPTALVWASSWLVGAGFAVGEGTIFSPDRVVPGPVPALPMLGLLPSSPLQGVGLYLPLVVTAGAMVAAWRRRRVLYSLRVRYAVAAALLAGAVVALGLGGACLAASGPVGPGTMTVVGPQTGYAVLLVFLEVSAGLGAIAVLSHPYTLSLATEAASGARQRVGETMESAAESARERRAARAKGALGDGSADGAAAPVSAASPGGPAGAEALPGDGSPPEGGPHEESAPRTASATSTAGTARAVRAAEAGPGDATDRITAVPAASPTAAAQAAGTAQRPPRRPAAPWSNWREQAARAEQAGQPERAGRAGPQGGAGSAESTRSEEDDGD